MNLKKYINFAKFVSPSIHAERRELDKTLFREWIDERRAYIKYLNRQLNQL
jgi:hypothetical protein